MHIDLELGDVRAQIGRVAAVLRSLSVGGAAVTEPHHDEVRPPFANGVVLAPWPNRVRDGRWDLNGVAQQLDITEPANGSALHGLLQFTEYAVVEQADDAVTLRAFIAPQHGWPFALDTTVRYALDDLGMTVTHTATNQSTSRAPWAVGSHPFLRAGDAPVEQLTLTVPADRFVQVDERLLPVAELPVTPDVDLRGGRSVSGLRLDTAFGLRDRGSGLDHRMDSAWLTAPDGARTTLWQGADWGYLQIFTTEDFPRGEGTTPGLAIAVEPMTAAPDALNTGLGLVWLEPGSTWKGSWGLRHTAGSVAEGH